MANGTLGTTLTTANAYVQARQITPTAAYATISINLVNTNATTAATIRIAITDSTGTTTNVGTADYKKAHIEYGAKIDANGGVLERTCIPVSGGDIVFVWSDVADVAVRVFGLEQLTA